MHERTSAVAGEVLVGVDVAGRDDAAGAAEHVRRRGGAARSSAARPTATMRPPATATAPSTTTSRVGSIVTTSPPAHDQVAPASLTVAASSSRHASHGRDHARTRLTCSVTTLCRQPRLRRPWYAVRGRRGSPCGPVGVTLLGATTTWSGGRRAARSWRRPIAARTVRRRCRSAASRRLPRVPVPRLDVRRRRPVRRACRRPPDGAAAAAGPPATVHVRRALRPGVGVPRRARRRRSRAIAEEDDPPSAASTRRSRCGRPRRRG